MRCRSCLVAGGFMRRVDCFRTVRVKHPTMVAKERLRWNMRSRKYIEAWEAIATRMIMEETGIHKVSLLVSIARGHYLQADTALKLDVKHTFTNVELVRARLQHPALLRDIPSAEIPFV